MPTIQLKVSGAWRTIITVDQADVDHSYFVIQATLRALRMMFAPRLLGDDGKEHASHDFIVPDRWHPITDAEPAALHDVIVTAKMDIDGEPLTFMAYRKTYASEVFYVSGTSDERLEGVYAYCNGPKAAPLSMRENGA